MWEVYKKALDECSSKLLPHVFNSYTKQFQSPENFMAQPIHFHRGKAATQSKLKFPIIAGETKQTGIFYARRKETTS